MSTGDPFNFDSDYIKGMMEKDIQESMTKAMKDYSWSMATTTTTATSAANSIYPSVSFGQTTTGTGAITIGSPTYGNGTLTTNNTGNLSWNGNSIAYYIDKPKVNRISDLLSDGMSREIILCKDREECQQKYGEYGLKMFDSMLNEVLQEAIKSEQAFNALLQVDVNKVQKLHEFIMSITPEDKKKALAVAMLELTLGK